MIRPGVVVAVFSMELGLLYYGSGELCIFLKEQVPLLSSLWTWARFFFFGKEALHVFSRHFPFSAGWDWASRPPLRQKGDPPHFSVRVFYI